MRVKTIAHALILSLFLMGTYFSNSHANNASPPTPTLKNNKPKTKKVKNGLERVTVYVPYRKFNKILKTDGVFLSRQQFNALMKIVQRERNRHKNRYPVKAILTNAKYTGTFTEKSARLTATLSIRILQKSDWTMISLPFSGLPLLNATLDGKPALLFNHPTRRTPYTLMVKGQGTFTLKLQFAGAVYSKPGLSSIYMNIPPTPYTQVQFDIQGTGLKAFLNRNTYTPNKALKGQWTQIKQVLTPTTYLSLKWFPKKKRKQIKKSLISTKITSEHSLTQGVIRTHSQIQFQILQAKTNKLSLQIPTNYKLISVQGGSNLKSWRTQKVKQDRHLFLTYHRKFDGRYTLRLELERLLKKNVSLVQLPSIHAKGAEWEQGLIALRVMGQFKLKPVKTTGLNQIDPHEYVNRTKKALPTLAFSYLKPDYQLSVRMEKIKPRIRATLHHKLTLDEKYIRLQTKAAFQIERAGIFQLRFALPDGWEYQDTLGSNIQDKYIEKNKGKKGKTLVVVLKRKTGGPQNAHVHGKLIYSTIVHLMGYRLFNRLPYRTKTTLKSRWSRPYAHKMLARLFGQKRAYGSGPYTLRILMRKKSKLNQKLSIPLVRSLDVKKQDEKGFIGLMMPSHLRIETMGLKGLFEVDNLRRIHAFSSATHKLRQALRYNQRPAAGQFLLRSKKTSIESQIWLPTALRADGYQLAARIRYKIRFAGTNKLQFSVPNEIAAKLKLQTEVRSTNKIKQKERTLYKITLHNKVSRGQYFDLTFNVQEKFKKPLKVGETRKLQLFSVTTPGAIKQELYFGLQKEESLSIRAQKPTGTERVDLSELPKFINKSKLSRAYRSLEEQPKPIAVHMKKHKYQPVLSALITHMHLDAVATLEGQLQVIAYLNLQSRGRQFLKVTFPKGAKPLSLQVQGKLRLRLDKDQDGSLLVDLTGISNRQKISIAVYYKQKMGKGKGFSSMSGQYPIEAPKVAETPISRTTFYLYLPNQFTYTHFNTKMWKSWRSKGPWQKLRDGLFNTAIGYYQGGFNGVRAQQNINHALYNKLPKRGKKFTFVQLSGAANVNFHYRSYWFQTFLEFIIFLALIGLLVILGGAQGREGLKPRLFIGMALGIAFLGAILPESMLLFCNTALMATGLVGLGWGTQAFFRAVGPKDPSTVPPVVPSISAKDLYPPATPAQKPTPPAQKEAEKPQVSSEQDTSTQEESSEKADTTKDDTHKEAEQATASEEPAEEQTESTPSEDKKDGGDA